MGPVLLLLLLAACSASGPSGPSDGGPAQQAEPHDLGVGRISSGAPGQGPRRPRIVLAPSAAVLSKEVGARVPDSGGGAYVAAYWGEKPTGGYSLGVAGARLEGDRATVRLRLEKPARGAILTQALTHPHVFAVVKGLDPGGKKFSFVDQNGRRLDWPVRRTGV